MPTRRLLFHRQDPQQLATLIRSVFIQARSKHGIVVPYFDVNKAFSEQVHAHTEALVWTVRHLTYSFTDLKTQKGM